MDAKVDVNRVQVAFTEEGSSFTALQYIFRDAQGNWSEPLEIDGPGNNRYNVGRDVAWTLTPPICQPLFISMGNLVFLISMI